MNERLLQFIWQFQYYQKQDCHTTSGEALYIERPGMLNLHQGPDFSEAMIRIGTTIWAGNIELHLRSSDWFKHQHSSDVNYGNIILHVVWEDDQPVHDRLGNRVPTFELRSRIRGILLDRYREMMETLQEIPCHSFLPALQELGWMSWKERLAAERLERKSAHVLDLLKQSNHHWEEVCWWMLAANFGIRVNHVLFEMVAKSIPINTIAKHKNQLHQLEALLLGQANLLSGKYEEAYPIMLQKEYRFLKKKYGLQPVPKQPAFLRMRPAAFPTVRLAQLAMLLNNSSNLFSMLKESVQAEKAMELFMVTANDYWNEHYRFDEISTRQPKHLGRQMAENILINSVIPLLFAYGLYSKEEVYKERCIQWLYHLPAEQNRITVSWQKKGITHRSALDLQALIELTNQYCVNKRCLDCAVGNKILKNYV